MNPLLLFVYWIKDLKSREKQLYRLSIFYTVVDSGSFPLLDNRVICEYGLHTKNVIDCGSLKQFSILKK